MTVGGQEIIAENGSVLAQAQPFGEGFAIADVDVENLWGARRGMSSFTVAASAEAAGYHETVFDMDFPEHPLLRPVPAQPFVPEDARAADLAGIDRSAVRVQFPGERPGEHTKTLLGSLAEALGCTVSDAGQPPFANPAEALVNPVDMTELALGVSDFPLDLSMQYAVNSQLVRSFVPLILARAAQTAEDGQLCAALEPIIAHSDPLHVPEHDHYAARGFADIAPTEVEDFFIDGFLRAQYRPSKSFRLAQCAFGSKYSDRELLMWMRTFYGRFFATQFMRHDLPDGPRIGSAGLALRDGFMMPTYAQGALWLDEVDALLARIGE